MLQFIYRVYRSNFKTNITTNIIAYNLCVFLSLYELCSLNTALYIIISQYIEICVSDLNDANGGVKIVKCFVRYDLRLL